MANGTVSNNYTTMEEYMYLTYHNAGRSPRVFMGPVLLFIIMILGYIGNSLVIIATVKNKKLQGSCNIFLCTACFADMMHQSSHWIYLYTTLISGENFITLRLCFLLQIVPLFFITISVLMTLFVGVDRLYSVLLPVYYNHMNRYLYVGGIYAASIAIGMFFVGLSYMAAIDSKIPVLCIILSGFGGAAPKWLAFCVLINIFDLIIYLTVGALLKRKNIKSDGASKIFRSLFVIMLTVTLGWLINCFIEAVLVPALVPVEYQYEPLAYLAIPVNLASASNFLTLYIFSKEYRLTFLELLPFLGKGPKVLPIPQSQVSQNRSQINSITKSNA